MTEVNCSTGEVIIRELNDEEFAKYEESLAIQATLEAQPEQI
jgi:hypothetical protein